jgi:hypothetical protein
LLFACSSDATTNGPTAPDGSTGSGDAGSPSNNNNDGGLIPAANDATSAIDANANDSGGADDGAAEGADCTFNKDCQSTLRCHCADATGCTCMTGARGTGQNGINECDSGDQCASSLCVEGTPANTFYCSDECLDANGCKSKLPKCLPTAGFPGSICVRNP